VKRILWLVIRTVVVLTIVVYLVDWALLRVRLAHGQGYSTVQVDEYLSTPLKGNKAEYDYMGSQPVTCARSYLPHGTTPCWWLRRHPAKWE
jgi:hypothetical protein